MRFLVTGAAGFIGFHLVKRLCESGHEVVGLDSLSDYYDVNLKFGRLKVLGIDADDIIYNMLIKSNLLTYFCFVNLDIVDLTNLEKLFGEGPFDVVCNLAAQAGVRNSMIHPHDYVSSNVTGFLNVLECCRHFGVKHFVFASSSSVYGLNEKYPFSTSDSCDHPVSLYAATKKANEVMAHSYSHLYGIAATGLRFFTVYGPWGRPDMAPFLFADAMLHGRAIKIFNNGEMQRDFTYIDDIVEGIMLVAAKPATPSALWDALAPDPSISSAAYRIYNIGNSAPVALMDFIRTMENALGIEAVKEFLPIQPGDVVNTYSDTRGLMDDFGYCPNTKLKQGMQSFIDWYRGFYGL
ncbi:MAG: hypothetical protein RIS47_1090 [Bacteroidota bacterium]